jgi:hypothetical protein
MKLSVIDFGIILDTLAASIKMQLKYQNQLFRYPEEIREKLFFKIYAAMSDIDIDIRKEQNVK